jgi:LPS-assembly lipoprotein
MINRMRCFLVVFSVLVSLLAGCGFQLRGNYTIPASLHTIQLQPYDPYNPFQRILKRNLKANDIHILDNLDETKKITTLYITSQTFTERTIAYGTDGQASRAILQLKVVYQILDTSKKIDAEQRVVQVERELALNPNAIN